MVTIAERIKNSVETAGQSLLERLREITRPHKKGVRKLALDVLNDQQLLEIYFWMRDAGKTDHWIAKRIMSWGYSPDRDIKSWRKMVKKFRDKAMSDISKASTDSGEVVRRTSYYQKIRAKKLVEKVDALEVLHSTLSQQKERAELFLSLEREVLLPDEELDLTDDMKTARLLLREMWVSYFGPKGVTEALDSLVRTADTVLSHEYKLGIRDNQPSKATLEIQHKFQGLLEHSISNDGAMLTEGIHNLMERMEKESILLTRDESGQWDIEKEIDDDNTSGDEGQDNDGGDQG